MWRGLRDSDKNILLCAGEKKGRRNRESKYWDNLHIFLHFLSTFN